jgi:basic amino acid/polyamine antiporter, APA family
MLPCRGNFLFIRTIGRWAFAALVINAIIGGGVFGVPSQINALLGRAGPLAVIVVGITTAITMGCFAEIASQFPGHGGPYLYVRTTFGRFAGLQVAWFAWLTRLTSAAAVTNLFVIYLAGLWPWAATVSGKTTVVTVMLSLLILANYVGARTGANLSTTFAVAKLAPLILISLLGIIYFFRHSQPVLTSAEIIGPGGKNWFEALLILSFLYGGYENALYPMGEVKNPRRDAPFALGTALLICVALFCSIQFVVTAVIGTQATDRPLAATAAVLLGPYGSLFITIAALISAYGYLAGSSLTVPRLMFSLGEAGDFPSIFDRVHPRFRTPHVSIVIFGVLLWLFAVTGSFRWTTLLSSGARLITYGVTCATLIPLRRRNPDANAYRLPFGATLSVVSVLLSAIVVAHVSGREAVVLGVTVLIAALNWLWVRRKPQNAPTTIAAVR